jgi:hypothetical protein
MRNTAPGRKILSYSLKPVFNSHGTGRPHQLAWRSVRKIAERRKKRLEKAVKIKNRHGNGHFSGII